MVNNWKQPEYSTVFIALLGIIVKWLIMYCFFYLMLQQEFSQVILSALQIFLCADIATKLQASVNDLWPWKGKRKKPRAEKNVW